MKRPLALVALVAAVGVQTPCFAADPNASALAEALFDQGRTALEQGRTAEACEKFAASRKIDPAPGTTLNLAGCYAKLGRTASAWGIFTDAEADARRDGDPRRQKEAHDRAAELEPKLARLRIELESKPPSTRVDVDGETLSATAAESNLPIDPGTHHLKVSAPGYLPTEVTVEIAPGPSEAVQKIPALKLAPPPPIVEPPPSEKTVPFWSGTRVAAAVSAGIAVAAAGVGTGFGVVASSKWSDASNGCPANPCTNAGARQSGKDAGTFADVSTGLFVGAGVFAAAAVVLYVVSPRPTPKRAVGVTPNGVLLKF
ncbi:MAG TPA: PEGA domain-containing protein [Polyangiaceae bacterium]